MRPRVVIKRRPPNRCSTPQKDSIGAVGRQINLKINRARALDWLPLCVANPIPTRNPRINDKFASSVMGTAVRDVSATPLPAAPPLFGAALA
jgi:hypothetical protein